ncbi:SMC-Scp complex subunit ScpB [Mesorhizobium sp. M1076]|uniref:SMC-Scp complex subunit ScpB n=1 Tax=Mesorhizobium sp. M1076 TaxID=2957054 RepID=UPI0033350BE3
MAARPTKARRENGDGQRLLLDRDLDHLPPEVRWREWMGRVEAVIFASHQPVSREVLARMVGRDCNLDLVIDDIRAELRGRPYDLVAVADGWQHRTRPAFSDAIRAASGVSEQTVDLSQSEALVLMTVAYFQPITRAELSGFFGREISRDLIGNLRGAGFIASGPRAPQPGAPYTYVTTKTFLSHFSFETLRDLPDMEKLEDAGLLDKAKLLADLSGALGIVSEDAEAEEQGLP